jgi:MFS-type transporter involved in bile tolerance (Atg22 family)
LPITIALLAAMLGAVAFEYNARSTGLSLTVKLGIAAIAFLVALEASYAWNRAYRRELLESAG